MLLRLLTQRTADRSVGIGHLIYCLACILAPLLQALNPQQVPAVLL